jgi:hypothetical protein
LSEIRLTNYNTGAATKSQKRRPPTAREGLQQLKAASNRISFDGKPVNQRKESLRLTQEQEIVSEGLDRGDRSPVLCQSWPNHGTLRQTLADESAGLRQNQVRLS